VKRVIVVGPARQATRPSPPAWARSLACQSVIELDKLFWRPGLAPTPREEWAAIQRQLAAQDSWIMDGDLGPYDVINVRLQAADTVMFLDFSAFRCAWRAIRRSRERADFWRWLLTYRRRSRPLSYPARPPAWPQRFPCIYPGYPGRPSTAAANYGLTWPDGGGCRRFV